MIELPTVQRSSLQYVADFAGIATSIAIRALVGHASSKVITVTHVAVFTIDDSVQGVRVFFDDGGPPAWVTPPVDEKGIDVTFQSEHERRTKHKPEWTMHIYRADGIGVLNCYGTLTYAYTL